MTTCSVIILTFNSDDDIVDTLDAITDQDVEFEYEIIVADNNSSDNTVSTVRDSFPQVRVVEFEKNWGASIGYNKALSETNGEYVAYLNPDTTVHRDWLQTLLEGMRCANADAAMSSVFEPGDYQYEQLDREGTHEVMKVKDVAATGYVYNGEHENAHRPVRTLHLAGNSMLFRRDVFDELPHPFEEAFFLFADDIDIALRLNVLGMKTVMVPDAVVYHHQYDLEAPSSLIWLAKKSVWAHSGRLLSFYKNMHFVEFLSALPLLLAGGALNAREIGGNNITRILFSIGGLGLSVVSLFVFVFKLHEIRDHRQEVLMNRTREPFWLLRKMIEVSPPRTDWILSEE